MLDVFVASEGEAEVVMFSGQALVEHVAQVPQAKGATPG